MSVCQLIPEMDGAVIVTTPQDVAILDSRKSINFAKQLSIPVIGIVENMSQMVCPHCGKEIDLFGTGGGEKAALDMQVPFLGKIPLDPEVVKSGDLGKPFISGANQNGTAEAVKKVVERIMHTE